MGRDRDAEPSGDAPRRCIGRDSSDPTLGPFSRSAVLKRTPPAMSSSKSSSARAVRDRCRCQAAARTGIVRRQHAPQRRVVAPPARRPRASSYLADEFTQKLDVLAQSRICRVG